ncbi:DUF3325 domain-containing protein [Sphingopyxis sp. BSN-002]|uniref:DUF3325 domain-containing protein n=1 Tax=Sphingopyxis sp. BSN-002 TaxID=2911495 RepID=UPI001EDA5601|nr:DUF3325 domain-containing protein [Sphingopyxis sp. BSN-002]UKK83958.1 DUF3325 domain-containing protein [Sphingopyxis sp. BSN-002]
MIHILLFGLACAGFAMLCLARDRHQRDLLGRKLPAAAPKALRAAGWACLALAFVLAGRGLGWAYGTVEWLGQMSAGALVTVLFLTRLSARTSSSRRAPP